MPFNKLDVDQIISQNLNVIRNCLLLEKTLPKNDIIPKLRTEAEEFKEKIPTLQCLRSSDLKPVC
jgi:dynein heavy chain